MQEGARRFHRERADSEADHPDPNSLSNPDGCPGKALLLCPDLIGDAEDQPLLQHQKQHRGSAVADKRKRHARIGNGIRHNCDI